MFYRSKFIFGLICSFFSLSISSSMYMQWNWTVNNYPGPSEFNSSDEVHYNKLVNYDEMLTLISQYASHPQYSDWKKQIDDHQSIMEDVRKLPVAGGWCIIDKEWAISANHVLLNQFSPIATYGITHSNGFVSLFDKVYVCSIEGVDLCIGHLQYPIEGFSPIKIFRGTAKELIGKEIFACSDVLHNSGGSIIAEYQKEKNITTYGKCILNEGQNFLSAIVGMSFDVSNAVQTSSYGGDSGGPVIVRINNTGDLEEDYRCLGVYNPTGPGLNLMCFVNPLVLKWADSVINPTAENPSPLPTKELGEFILVSQ